MHQFKSHSSNGLTGHVVYADAATERMPAIVPDTFDPWDKICTWTNTYIKNNPGILYCYRDGDDFIEIKYMANHDRKTLMVSIFDVNGKERKSKIPKGTPFMVFLASE